MENIKKLEENLSLEKKILFENENLLEKALKSSDPEEVFKAQAMLKNIEERQKIDRKSYVINPLDVNQSYGGYKEKPYVMSYSLLQNMAKTPIINAIIRTRIAQVAAFAEPQSDKYSTGYVIRKKKRRTEDKEDKLTKQEQKEIDFIYDFIERCGDQNDWEGDDFDAFIRKWFRDLLTMDQGTFEVVRDRKGQIHEFFATDGSTYRIATSFDTQDYTKFEKERTELYRQSQTNRKKPVKGYLPAYVQIFNRNIEAEFYPWELCFGVRNPQSDVRLNGYGISELEEMITTITAMLWSEDYNRRFFKQGSIPKGLIKVKGDFNDSKLQELRQAWSATLRGVQNSWKTPVLPADIDYINLETSNRDMEFSHWLEYLIKVGCAVYLIDPAEINFPLSGGSEQKAMFEGNNEARLKHSRDKGLYPLLKFGAKKINKYIVSQLFEGKYEFAFMGIGGLSIENELDMDIKMLHNFMTPNEIRRKRGLKDIEGGDIILDGTYMQNKQAQEMAQQQEQGTGDNEHEQFAEPDENQENPFSKALDSYLNKTLTK